MVLVFLLGFSGTFFGGSLGFIIENVNETGIASKNDHFTLILIDERRRWRSSQRREKREERDVTVLAKKGTNFR